MVTDPIKICFRYIDTNETVGLLPGNWSSNVSPYEQYKHKRSFAQVRRVGVGGRSNRFLFMSYSIQNFPEKWESGIRNYIQQIWEA
jgi:hypothetical protein